MILSQLRSITTPATVTVTATSTSNNNNGALHIAKPQTNQILLLRHFALGQTDIMAPIPRPDHDMIECASLPLRCPSIRYRSVFVC